MWRFECIPVIHSLLPRQSSPRIIEMKDLILSTKIWHLRMDVIETEYLSSFPEISRFFIWRETKPNSKMLELGMLFKHTKKPNIEFYLSIHLPRYVKRFSFMFYDLSGNHCDLLPKLVFLLNLNIDEQ